MQANQKIPAKEKITYPDYSDSIVNLSASILQHFGIKPKHETLSKADEILSRNYKHVVVILLDGLGMNILESNLNYRDFLRRNLLSDYSSVFPPTTTASTIAFMSEQTPIEHGWLGWDVYFEQEDKTITCFFNTLQNSKMPAADYNIPMKYLPYETLVEKINKSGNAKAYSIFPFPAYGFEGYRKQHDWIRAIKKTTESDETTFTYAYWDDPDGALHQFGNGSREVEKTVRNLNNSIIDLCQSTEDTLYFITADHGHINNENIILSKDYTNITNMLERPISIEPRAISFYVKPDYKEKFPEEFNKYFGEDFALFTKEEVLEKQIFGTGEPHENLTGIGDYVAVAVSNKTLLWDDSFPRFRSNHAGMTKEEMRIPLIWHESKKKKSWLRYYYGTIVLIIASIIYLYFV